MKWLFGCLMTVICFLLVGADAEASRRHRSKNQCNGEACSSPVAAQCSKPAQAVKKDCQCDNCKCQQCECDRKSKKK